MNVDNSDVNPVEQRPNIKRLGDLEEDKSLALRIGNSALSREVQILRNSSKRIKSQYTSNKLQLEKAERDNNKLNNLMIVKIYKKLLGIKKKTARLTTFFNNKPGAGISNKAGISVVIPTYTKNAYLEDAIKSVLNQDYPSDKREVIIAVNGADVEYYHELKNKYASNDNIKVVYTETKGANAGRKTGLDHVSFPYFTFLDDDDFFTDGYFNYMVSGIQDDETNIVIGKLNDFDENGNLVSEDTYLNKSLSSFGEGKTRNYLGISSLFSNLCGKLFRTAFFKESFSIGTNFQHTEDVIFWAENYNHIAGDVYLCNTNGNEAYCRRLTTGSLSRPDEDKKTDFFIKQRLTIIEYLSNLLISKNYDLEHKRFILKFIKAQNSVMLNYYKELTDNQKEDAFKEINSSRCAFVTKSKFSDKKAIAFCHNFSPFIDASAFVATKRLREIDEMEGQALCWLVIDQNMANVRSKDQLFHEFYSYFQFDKLSSLPGNASSAVLEQCRFGYFAFKKVENMDDVEVIYSRAQFVGSHIAAWLYKLSHPNVKWYAEFSDPIVYGIDNKVKTVHVDGENAYLKDYLWYIEQFVYTYADRVIFTNQNQMNYMLGYNLYPEDNEAIRKKAIIKHHPIMPEIYTRILESDYNLEPDKINIGYFGTFYPNRNLEDMLQLLTNKKVVLHIFTPNSEKLKESYPEFENRIRFNDTISNFEFLNLASKMDYLFLNDTNFDGEINPYLPSKYADYKVTNTRIIVKTVAGSVLSEMDDKQLIKCKFIDENFAQHLSKQVH